MPIQAFLEMFPFTLYTNENKKARDFWKCFQFFCIFVGSNKNCTFLCAKVTNVSYVICKNYEEIYGFKFDKITVITPLHARGLREVRKRRSLAHSSAPSIFAPAPRDDTLVGALKKTDGYGIRPYGVSASICHFSCHFERK